VAALTVSPRALEAREDARLRINIAAATLPEAIAELAREANISVGTEGQLPVIKTAPLNGQFTPEAALARLLRGSGYVVRRVGPTAWRIERAPAPTIPRATPPPPAPDIGPVQQIVVRATKRDLTLASAPVSATVVTFKPADRVDPASGTRRVAEQVEGLALTGLGAGRNRMFLRGVADSPFGGKSQATVAILLDDARVTYTAPDPDIRLVDVSRVELLKGPQGSLYGTGALGGIYRIVTNRADPSGLSIAGSVSGVAVADGDWGEGGSLVVNVPLVQDVVALRLVAYGEKAPGWLATGSRNDSNGTTVAGVRGGLGIEWGGGWRLDATGLGQWLQAHDSNYVYEPRTNRRPAQWREPNGNKIVHGSMRLAREGATQIVFSSGYTVHDVDDRYDATQGADSFGLPDPQTLDDDAHYRLWDSEARMAGHWGDVGWLGGLSHVAAWQDSTRALQGASGTRLVVESVDRWATESSAFGEVTVPLAKSLDATLGGRLSHSALHEDRATSTGQGVEETRRTSVTPSASLAWHPRPGRLLYMRYGSAVRQGGTTLDASGKIEKLDEDQLMTFEGGWRESIGAVGIDLGLYRSWWKEIQSDVLLANGLIETANVGDGSITGAELALKAQFGRGWSLDAGAMAQSAMLTRNTAGIALDDLRLPVVPAWTVRSSLSRTFSLGAWDGTLSANARYVGPARLSFDPNLDRRMGNYLETGLRASAQRGRWVLALETRNVFNARGDTFAYGNPLRIFSTRQYVRQDPFSLRMSVNLVE
jgi:outer membrane receptor protein involved in Fe transport